MNLNSHSRYLAAVAVILAAVASAQIEPAGQQTVTAPVSYASLSQVTSLLAQLEQQSQATQIDLAKLRIDRWKTDSTSKRQAQSNVESVTRNLHDALPAIMGNCAPLRKVWFPHSSFIAIWMRCTTCWDRWSNPLGHLARRTNFRNWLTI